MSQNNIFRKIPAVDKLLKNSQIVVLKERVGEGLTKYAIRSVVDTLRAMINNGEDFPQECEIISMIIEEADKIAKPALRSVLNGSGIVLHTNLGRAPLGEKLLSEVSEVLVGYNNLEFNLAKGRRGERNSHATSIIRYLTGAEDVVIVNNNAAAVLLILTAFGAGREAIVSRGELIEIGGSFRIPDIMKSSGCKMVEVGATNKTKVKDYEEAICDDTSILFKAHQSNYVIKGFTEEVSISELADIARRHNKISVYDIGSGLLRKVDAAALKSEPDVKEAIAADIDIVCFSGDKLLGAAQAGIIAGKKCYIDILKRHPLMRALRVCKTTLAVLETACRYYLDDEKLFKNNILFSTLNKKREDILSSANQLSEALRDRGVNSDVSQSDGQYGGGTLPDLTLPSYQVRVTPEGWSGVELYHALLECSRPLLTNLKSGDIYVDTLCVQDNDIEKIADIITEVVESKKVE